MRGQRHVYEREMDSEKLSAIFGEDMSDVMVSKKRSLDELLDRFKSGLEKLGILSLASSNKIC